ncbi:molybdopterin-dependent oxidoreductase [Nocardia sp. NPDC051911]|uniref:molybdopterin-dependent oxidoreductase n=1 Tax=Nocardia sp. NPDC051911 TaxID=3154648 RepID=UPI003414B089
MFMFQRISCGGDYTMSATGAAVDALTEAGRAIRGSGGGGTAKAACNLCEAICGIEITIEGGRAVGVRGDRDDPLSRGHVCPKSVAMTDVHSDPDRLRRPLRKIDGEWVEVDWSEAINAAARGLAQARRRHGANAVAVYLGNPSVHSLGAMTHGSAFASLLRTHNHFSASSVDQLPHQVVSALLYGHQFLLPEPDLDRTQHLLMFGANPRASNGSLMTAPDMARRLREIRERGGRVTVIDPRRTETAADADEHVFIRPGTDAAVLLAMVHVVLRDRAPRLPDYITGADALRDAVAEFTPEAAGRFSGVPAATITRLAHSFADAGPAACYGRFGVSTQRHGTVCQWAIQVLNIITGNLGREGGTLFTDPAIDMTRLLSPGHFGRRRSRVRGLPSFAGEFPVAALAEEITTPGQGQVRALLTIAGNPVLSTPAGAALGTALGGLDFMVAVDFYLNETTRHADVILPPTSALERDHYDLVFRSFAVRNTAKYSPAVLPKPRGARHDWEIFRDLGSAYQRHLGGGRMRVLRRRLSRPAVATEIRLRTPPRRLVDLLLRTGRYKLSVRRLLAHPAGLDLGPLRPGVEHRLRTPDRRLHLVPPEIADALDTLRSDLGTAPADPGSLLLIGRRHLRSNNSWMHNYARLVAGPQRHHLLMHPADAARLGLADGPAVLRSRTGAVRVDVRQTTDIMAGTVSLPHGYGHAAAESRLSVASRVAGASANDVTDPLFLDTVSGNAALNGIPVTVEPLPDSR